MRFQIADFIVDISDEGANPIESFADYVTDAPKTDILAFFTKEEWKSEWRKMELRNAPMAANFCGFRAFAEQLPLYNAFVLHSACFDVDGVGVAFAAHSGTGKTTHMMLWQQLLGDRMTIVNGDKPIVRFFDEPDGSSPTSENSVSIPPYAYGTPWNGKEHLGCNMRTPLRHICFIERAKQNSCEPMTDISEAITRVFNQVYMPKDPVAATKTVELIDRLMNSVQLWKIKCNMDPSAAKVAYNTIFGK